MTERFATKHSQRPKVSKRERLLQKLSQDVEQFTPRLLHIEEIARHICETITGELGFHFASVQLIDFEERCIQTVYGSYGSGASGQWHSVAKHSLEVPANFLDIQADIALATPPVSK